MVCGAKVDMVHRSRKTAIGKYHNFVNGKNMDLARRMNWRETSINPLFSTVQNDINFETYTEWRGDL